jgi:drug/metabolite transporter (DMT)-like permease
MPSSRALATGVACALAAGLVWGLVFVAPVLLPDYPPAMLAFGRYLAFGAVALPLAWHGRAALARLSRADWREALRLALVGNVLYYLFLSAAIQAAGVPVPTMIIGTLPVVIAVCSNLSAREFAWARLAPSLALIAAGLACVNADELRALSPGRAHGDHAVGALLALGAMACWTWYPIRNARWLKANRAASAATWATAQGVATLPLAAIGMAATLAWTWPGWGGGVPDGAGTVSAAAATEAWPLGPRPLAFVLLMLAIGLSASWLGTLLWNRASALLPTSLAGQLIVFETLAALLYGYLHRAEWPRPLAMAGIALLVAGVVGGTRALGRPAVAAAAASGGPDVGADIGADDRAEDRVDTAGIAAVTAAPPAIVPTERRQRG